MSWSGNARDQPHEANGHGSARVVSDEPLAPGADRAGGHDAQPSAALGKVILLLTVLMTITAFMCISLKELEGIFDPDEEAVQHIIRVLDVTVAGGVTLVAALACGNLRMKRREPE